MGIQGLKANWYHWSNEVSRLAPNTKSCLAGPYRWACIQSDRNWKALCDYYGEDETHGIDSTGQPFAYDTAPLPLLNPSL